VLIELSVTEIIVLNVAAWAAIHLGLAWAFTQLAPERFHPDGFLARPRGWERAGRFYERVVAIRSWKHKLPDGASWFAGGVSKARLPGQSSEALYCFARETWRGELVHWLALLFLPVFCVWNLGWAMGVNAAYAVAANLPCILVQRYNRARIRRLFRDERQDTCLSVP